MKNSTLAKTLLLLCSFTFFFLSQGCLGIVQFLAPNSANAGQAINTFVRVKPYNTNESQVKVSYFLSSDHFWDKEDELLHVQESYLELNATHLDLNASFSLPADLNSGEYFLLAIAYETENIWIYGQGQNIFHRKIEIVGSSNNQADLMLANVYLDKRAVNYYQTENYYPGTRLKVPFSLENKGPIANASSITLRYYLSRSATFSLSDPSLSLLDEDFISTIAANERVELSMSFIAPNTSNYGAHYLHIVADFWNSTDEINENNNIATRLFNIREKREDHYISSLDCPGLVLAEQAFSVVYREGINSRIGNYSSQVGIYLSIDDTYSNDDDLIFSGATSNSGASSSYLRNRSVTIPGNTPTGSYYLIVRMNPNNFVSEYDYTNNEKAIRVFVISTTNLTDDDICEEVANSLEEREEAHLEKVSNLARKQETPAADLEMNVYPNPASEKINMRVALKKEVASLRLEVINNEGNVLHSLNAFSVPAGEWNKEIDIRLLPAGTYYVRIMCDDEVISKPLIVM